MSPSLASVFYFNNIYPYPLFCKNNSSAGIGSNHLRVFLTYSVDSGKRTLISSSRVFAQLSRMFAAAERSRMTSAQKGIYWLWGIFLSGALSLPQKEALEFREKQPSLSFLLLWWGLLSSSSSEWWFLGQIVSDQFFSMRGSIRF